MKYFNSQKGFTLIEMIVALGVFAVVAVIAIGSLLKISDANRKSLTLKTSINNLNFALESMSREMRLGSKYECQPAPGALGGSPSCPTNGTQWTLAFDSQNEGTFVSGDTCNLRYAYWYNGSTIKKAQQKRCDDTLTNQDSYFDVISPDINITKSLVSIDTTDQPKVFFWIKGEVGKREKEKTGFSLQTTISQRATKI